MSNQKARNGMPKAWYHQHSCQFLAVLAILILISVMGCSKRYSDLPTYTALPFREYQNESVGRFKSSYIAEQIEAYYRGVNPGPIGVTTFVNLDDLYSTSSFGRMYAEQLMSELTMKGFDVVELRHSDALQFLGNEGEFGLSRDVRAIKRERDLGGLLVGTYVVSPNRVYVNARLVDPSSSLVLSAGSVEFEKTKELARLLRGGAFPASLERIPVKHLGFSSAPVNVFAPLNPQWREEEATTPNPEFYANPSKKDWPASAWQKPALKTEPLVEH